MRATLRLLAGLAALSLAACASLGPRPELPARSALPVGEDTTLDRLMGEAEAQHPGASGFRLMSEGPESFAVRAHTAAIAGRSLDVQTYIWHGDTTGGFLVYRLLEAADRGVKVRLLVDDMDARQHNYSFAALAAHPNIEVRMFNPFKSRVGGLSFLFEAMGSFSRINRRMHNKTWIADNRLAVVGGRNLGDEYFGASDEVNFSDLDFAMVGPVVRDASASFDRYWNSPLAYPMDVLAPHDVTPAALAALREKGRTAVEQAETSRYTDDLRNNDAVHQLVEGHWPMNWTERFRFVSDDPLKALGKGGGINGSQVLELLGPMVKASHEKLTVISPYFVPGPVATKGLVEVARTGSDVRILTNSLAANDVAMVYGAYTEWREPLLKGGVRLWELKPTRGNAAKSSLFGSKGASLHTKALTVDGLRTFVGSYNLDPRSTALNCEQGVFVEEPAIAAQLEAIFGRESSGERAWQVTQQDGKTVWSDGTSTHDSAPEASTWRRFQAWLARALGLSSQL
ncbi:MAG TPA: phospholipase D family protein [Steroidobacteraceae bacterium]|nr:phospholipase D family protein [Steroidobacteraceae bacterium]